MVDAVQAEPAQGYRNKKREKRFIVCDHIQQLWFKFFSLEDARPG